MRNLSTSPAVRRTRPRPPVTLTSLLPWIALCVLSIALPARAQISPGPLAKAHQSLSSPNNCTKCHSVSAKTPSFRCTECHREIANELQQHHGLHSTFPQSGAPGVGCTKCHSDHNGEGFSMLHWDPTSKGFDHSRTGYLLEGKHAGVGCRSCHTATHINPSLRSLLSAKDLNRTYMGLSPSCVSCHQDAHQGRFGTNCSQCHSTADWKGAKIDTKGFDHSKTLFPLTGMHQTTACEKCHKPGPDGQPRYKDLQFSACYFCHLDPHKGEFKQKGCQDCHSTSSWTKTPFVSTFDHSKTKFPLLGKHQGVTCLSCHQSGDFKAPVPHTQCADCHKPDPHSGQFAARADGGRCESCHTVDGWSPSTFSVAAHAMTRFPLVSPHAKVECQSCHIPAGKLTRFKIKFSQCIDCHEDVHKGQFAGEPWRNRCEQCHKGDTFKGSNITLATHQQTRFPLTGGHVAVACSECHKPMAGSNVAVFHFARIECTTCHEDLHKGQFAERMALRNAAGKPFGCEACHSTKEWKDLTHFDHSKTKFALEGSHRSVACIDCHRPPNLETSMIHVQFAKASTQCSECHENPHSTQFGAAGENCASCHNSNKWRPSLFDHEKTVFSLKGGHQNVACSACHTHKESINGTLVLFYKPTPKACSDCHDASFRQH